MESFAIYEVYSKCYTCKFCIVVCHYFTMTILYCSCIPVVVAGVDVAGVALEVVVVVVDVCSLIYFCVNRRKAWDLLRSILIGSVLLLLSHRITMTALYLSYVFFLL